jgi:hypothetical protein
MQSGPTGAERPPGDGTGAGTGEPGASVNAPVFWSMARTEMVLLVGLRTKRNWSVGSVVTRPPSRDKLRSGPGVGVRVPSSPTENPATCDVVPPGIEA